MQFEIRDPLGKRPVVHFACPACRWPLKAPLEDAGSSDVCPKCDTGFEVPGEDGLRIWRAHQTQRDADSREKKKRHQERQITLVADRQVKLRTPVRSTTSETESPVHPRQHLRGAPECDKVAFQNHGIGVGLQMFCHFIAALHALGALITIVVCFLHGRSFNDDESMIVMIFLLMFVVGAISAYVSGQAIHHYYAKSAHVLWQLIRLGQTVDQVATELRSLNARDHDLNNPGHARRGNSDGEVAGHGAS